MNTEKVNIMYTNLQFLWGEVPAGNWLWCRVTAPGITLKIMKIKKRRPMKWKTQREELNRIYNVKVILPSKDWKRASSWLGRIGPLLGPMCPHEGAKTDLSSHPLCFDWAYKPGGVGRGSGGERRRIGRGKGQRWKWNDIKNVMEKKNGYNKNCENIKKEQCRSLYRSKTKANRRMEIKRVKAKQEMHSKEKRKRVILWLGAGTWTNRQDM